MSYWEGQQKRESDRKSESELVRRLVREWVSERVSRRGRELEREWEKEREWVIERVSRREREWRRGLEGGRERERDTHTHTQKKYTHAQPYNSLFSLLAWPAAASRQQPCREHWIPTWKHQDSWFPVKVTAKKKTISKCLVLKNDPTLFGTSRYLSLPCEECSCPWNIFPHIVYSSLLLASQTSDDMLTYMSFSKGVLSGCLLTPEEERQR